MAQEKSVSVDHLTIQYPMDRVTFGQVRRHEPRLFARVVHTDLGTEAMSAHSFEQCVAEKAFAKATGRPDPHPEYSRSELMEALDIAYQGFGLSTGPHQSMMLVQEIEASVSSAKETRKPSRWAATTFLPLSTSNR